MLDASVILKWVLTEENHTQALIFRDSHISGEDPVAVPELFFYEAANVLGLKSGLAAKDARASFESICSMELESYHLEFGDYRRALELSQKLNLSVYDASYLALAEKLDAPMITADKKLYRKCVDTGIVRPLGP